MTEQPKRRGRPSKADIAARQSDHVANIKQVLHATFPVMNGDTEHWPEPTVAAAKLSAAIDADVFARGMAELERAQAYALRVWTGQAADLKRAERIARCERALAGQNLPTDGIRYPGSDDDEEWDEADMQPVTWRKRS